MADFLAFLVIVVFCIAVFFAADALGWFFEPGAMMRFIRRVKKTEIDASKEK